jgi:Xaa-Pro aminopeptidase
MYEDRLKLIQNELKNQQVDALFLRLGVNVLAMLGYWPGNHAAAGLIPAEGKPLMLVPETEYEEAKQVIGKDPIELKTYALESPAILRGPMDAMMPVLSREINDRGLISGKVGLELSYEDGTIGRLADFKYPSRPTWDQLKDAFPEITFEDATGIISKLRMVKTKREIDRIRNAIAAALRGLDTLYNTRLDGMTEAQVGALIEGTIHSEGTGKNGLTLSRGFASVYAGARSADQWSHHAYSTGRMVMQGDMVIVELGSISDGYWCDLTRCAPAGKASGKMKDTLKILLEAQKSGLSAAKIGRPVSEVNNACHDFLRSKGFDETYYKHACGHGTGFNYHEGPPVHPACQQLMEEGMVLCIEPGLYFQGEFGLRTEDVFVVTSKGAELLSRHPDSFID